MIDIYKQFRTIEKIASQYTLSKRFDEPTYFSFRLLFGSDSDNMYNYAGSRAIYDTMPHPLFNKGGESQLSGGGTSLILNEQNTYSAIQYLIDANEPTRAEMMREFISKFNSLQNDFPYYFQSIEGLSNLVKVDPTKGQRLPNDTKITITCLEGLDLRMSYLLNLYKKIAWDDVYQRWVLPDMMRYFTLKIYLSEFRTFHLPQINSNLLNGYGEYSTAGTQSSVDSKQSTSLNMANKYANQLSNTVKKLESNSAKSSTDVPLFLSILDDILPTWELKCEMCEFDITSIEFDHVNSANVVDPKQGSVKFSINVGNVYELQTYPVFEHMFINDKNINGINRSVDLITTKSSERTKYQYPASLHIAQTREPASDNNTHIPGMPYNERRNENNVSQAKTSLDENTWIGNAVETGTAYIKNLVNTAVSKATTTPIPHIGLSLSEITTALESKDIVSAIGMIRKAVNTVVNEYQTPSSKLNEEITTDNIMKEFLTNLSKSTATDESTIKMQQAANMILNDERTWEKIKDFSLATNMIGDDEKNTEVKISNDLKKELDNKTVSSKLEGADIKIPIYSPLKMTTEKISSATASEKISESIDAKALDRTKPSVNLSNNIDEKLKSETASSHLYNMITDSKIIMQKPSAKLSSELENEKISAETPSERLNDHISKVIDNNITQTSVITSEKNSNIAASSNLSEKIQKDLLQPDLESKSKNIQQSAIIEALPSSNNISSNIIRQPDPGQASKNKIIKP